MREEELEWNIENFNTWWLPRRGSDGALRGFSNFTQHKQQVCRKKERIYLWLTYSANLQPLSSFGYLICIWIENIILGLKEVNSCNRLPMLAKLLNSPIKIHKREKLVLFWNLQKHVIFKCFLSEVAKKHCMVKVECTLRKFLLLRNVLDRQVK